MPRFRHPDHGLRPARLALLAVLLLGLALAGHGQGIDNSPRHYFNERSFEIPFDVQNNRRVKQVILHASTDGKTFKEYARVDPSSTRNFTYNAAGDGWFSFVVQVEDIGGGMTPPRINELATDLRVCVDTEKPTVLLDPVAPQDGQAIAVEWEVKDNREIDLRRIRLDYRGVGEKSWSPLNIRQLARAQFSWTPPQAGDYEVQLTVFDMARNMTQKQVRLRAATGGGGAANSTPVPGGGGGGADTVKVKHVPSKTFKLSYKIENSGPSGVKYVEVWHTRDTRQWSKHTDNAKPDPGTEGFEITVPVTGRHGFTLRPISGVGRGPRAPNVNEQPQIWVEVDESNPTVRLKSVLVGEGADKGMLVIRWDANDKWLREKPITMFYAVSKPAKDEDWTLLKGDLPNTGMEKVTIPANLHEMYVKVVAIDEAGNKGSDQTKDSVKVDLSEPTIKDLDVIGSVSSPRSGGVPPPAPPQ